MRTEHIHQRIQRGAIVAILIIALVHFALRIDLAGSWRYDIAGAEPNVIHGVQKVMLGRSLYSDPEQAPFDFVQYTPAYYFVCGGIGKALGIDAFDVRSVYVLSRVLSLILNLLTALTVLLIVRERWVSRSWGWVVAALTFAAFSEHFYSRADSLYALLFALSLRQVLRALDAGTARAWALAAVLAVLCFLTKQTAVLLFLIVPLHLLLDRKWRPLIAFLGSAFVASLVGIALLLFLAPADHLWKNMVDGLKNGVSPNYLFDLFNTRSYFQLAGWHLIAVLLPIVLMRSTDPRSRFLALAMPLSVLFAVITAFKSGSQFNYFFESLVITFVAVALYSGPAVKEGSLAPPHWLRTAIILYALVFCVQRTVALRTWSGKFGSPATQYQTYSADKHVRDVLVNDLGLRDGEPVYVTYRGYLELFLNGNSLLSQKDIIEWSEDVPYDLSAFHTSMRDGSVRFVVTDAATDTIEVMDSTYTNYKPLRVVDGRHILVPSAR